MNGVTSRSRTVFRTLQRFKRTGSGVRRRFRPPYEAVRGGNFLFVNWKYVNGPIQKKKEISILHRYQFPHLSPTRLQYYVFSLQKVPHLFPHIYNITYFHCTYYLAGRLRKLIFKHTGASPHRGSRRSPRFYRLPQRRSRTKSSYNEFCLWNGNFLFFCMGPFTHFQLTERKFVWCTIYPPYFLGHSSCAGES